MPSGRKTSPVQARQRKPGRQRHEREARLERGIAEAALEVLRECEEETAVRGQSEDDGDQRGGHPRCAEDALRDQRGAATPLDGPLDRREDDDRDDAQGQ